MLIELLAAATPAIPPASPAGLQPPPRPASTVQPVPPRYAVVEGQHPEGPPGMQLLTVVCPGGLKALGAGWSAVVRSPPKPGASPQVFEEGVESVRAFPDSAGAGWQVSGWSAAAQRTRQPWRLAVRVVCMRVE